MLVKCLKLKKGFTLVELMGVIVILGVIALIAIPTIDRQLKEGKRDLSQAQLDNIKSAAKLWVADNPNDMPQNGEECYLKYSTLVDSGYAEENLKEISSNTDIVDNKLKIKISKDSTYNKYNYIVEFNNNGYTLSDTDKYCNSYTVTFDANGGNLSTDSKKVFYHSTYGELPTPTRDGYTFLGWNGKNLLNKNESALVGIKIESSLSGWAYVAFENSWVNSILNPSTIYSISYNVECTNVPDYDSKYEHGYGFFRLYDFSSKNGVRLGQSQYLGKGDKIHISESFTAPSNLYDANYKLIIYTNRYLKDNNGVLGSMIFSNIQLEKGSTATEYEPYYITPSTTVVQDHNHTLTAIWQANS